jgi:hypothetical protein
MLLLKVLFGVITGVSGSVMPVIFTVGLFIGVGILIPDARPEIAGKENPKELGLAFQAILTAGLALTWISFKGSGLFKQQFWGVLVHLPLADRTIFRSQFKKEVVSSFLLLYFILILYAYYAWTQHFSLLKWLLATVLAVLHWLTFLAMGMLPIARGFHGRSPSIPLLLLSILLLAGIAMAEMTGVVWHPNAVTVTSLLSFSLLPPGWVNGAFYYGLLRGEPAGWLLLLPSLGLVWLLIRMVRTDAWAEALTSEISRMEVVLPARVGPGSASACSPESEGSAAGPTEDLALERDEIQARIRDGGFLEVDWSRTGWMERLIGSYLSARERIIVEFRCGGVPPWSLQWKILAVCLAIATGLMFLPWDVKGALPFLALLIFIGIAAAYALGFALSKPPDRRSTPLLGQVHVYFPIGFREASWASMKIAVVQSIFWLVPAVAAGGIVAWQHHLSLVAGVITGGIPVLVVLAWQPVFICAGFPSRSSEFAQWALLVAWSSCLVGAGSATFILLVLAGMVWNAAALMLLVLNAWWMLLAGIVLLIVPSILWVIYAWMFDRGKVDSVPFLRPTRADRSGSPR